MSSTREKRYKLIVHVPLSHADEVRRAMGEAGGGIVGHYEYCSFSVRGVGRFRPKEGANPHIGRVGQSEEVEEESIEVSSIPASHLREVVDAMRAAHPYEETDFELIELADIECI